MFCVQLNTLHKCAESYFNERLLGMFPACLGISSSYMVMVLAVHWYKQEPCIFFFVLYATIVSYSEFNLSSCMGVQLVSEHEGGT